MTEEVRARARTDVSYRSAFIAGGAALIGAGIGAVVTIVVTLSQIHANKEIARNTFLRQERQAAYATCIADLQTEAAAESQTYATVEKDYDKNRDFIGALTTFIQSEPKYVLDFDTLSLVDSPAASRTVQKNLNVIFEVFDDANTMITFSQRPGSFVGIPQANQGMADDQKKVDMSDFLVVARQDLQT